MYLMLQQREAPAGDRHDREARAVLILGSLRRPQTRARRAPGPSPRPGLGPHGVRLREAQQAEDFTETVRTLWQEWRRSSSPTSPQPRSVPQEGAGRRPGLHGSRSCRSSKTGEEPWAMFRGPGGPSTGTGCSKPREVRGRSMRISYPGWMTAVVGAGPRDGERNSCASGEPSEMGTRSRWRTSPWTRPRLTCGLVAIAGAGPTASPDP